MTPLRARFKWLAIVGGAFLIGLAAIVVFGSIPPSDFPEGTIVTIPRNSGLTKIADDLSAQGVIRSAFLYKAYVVLLHDGTGVQAGEYLFDAPQSALRVAYRTAYGIEGLSKIKVTIPEGSDSMDISKILGKAISGFASTTFATLAALEEGYLFPDTYFFYGNTTPQEAIDAMKADFNARVATISSPISSFGKPEGDILKMASIVEKEATSTADRRIIAGILWKRLAAGMALQVDPAPDTYQHAGLPSTPIDNPGLDAILATVTPTDSAYWYYLSDKKENMHYAVTFDVQLANEAKYVK